MQIHNDRHHAACIANPNAAVKDWPQIAATGLSDMPAKLNELRRAIRPPRATTTGPASHSMFWLVMGGRDGAPSGGLAAAIDCGPRLVRPAEGGTNRDQT